MVQEPAIYADRLSKYYGNVPAIQNISFEVASGEVVGFLGPNGAGKSTTMRILVGLMHASSGCASICGISVPENRQLIKRYIGYMPENNPLPEDLRVIEYLRYRAHLKAIPAKELNRAVDRAMDLCDLNRKTRSKLIKNLSKGFRQRVGIADAILAEPPVVIMDEPTIGLDPHQVLGMRELISSLRGEMTVVISSHILPEIEASCDRMIIINKGHLVASGTADELRNDFMPGSEYCLSLRASKESVSAWAQKHFTSFQVTEEPNAISAVSFEMPSDDDAKKIVNKGLREHSDWLLLEFSRQMPTLESIFIAATKRSWDVVHGSEEGDVQ